MQDRLLVEISQVVVLDISLLSFDSSNAAHSQSSRGSAFPTARQIMDVSCRIDCGQHSTSDWRLGQRPSGQALQMRKPLVVAMDHNNRTGLTKTTLGDGREDAIQPW
jgi:hypothetical protein